MNKVQAQSGAGGPSERGVGQGLGIGVGPGRPAICTALGTLSSIWELAAELVSCPQHWACPATGMSEHLCTPSSVVPVLA